jgi:HPt (histidine-containing phosphotransfer) domain-containing protein
MSDVAHSGKPIDIAHLEQYTGGDARLNAEVFQLFSRHCVGTLRLLHDLQQAPQRKAWRDAAHALKGAALGIGAFGIADAAGDAEALDPESAPMQAAAVLRTLSERSEVVQAFIEAYLAG